MRPIRDTRRQNLAALAQEAGGQSALAQRLGKDKNQVYQWLLGDDQPGSRGLSDRTARAIEAAMGRPQGWLDHEPDGQSQPLSIDPEILGDAIRIARHLSEMLGWPLESLLDPYVLADAYEVALLEAEGETDLLASTKDLAARFRAREGGDNERSADQTDSRSDGKARKRGSGRIP